MSNNIIKELVAEKGLTLRQFAKLIGYDVSVVSRVQNRVQKMSYKMAVKISETFNISLDEIIVVENLK